ncbi:restriction endonuclease subunit S [Maritalea porphyrae]|nr:restriction endonuclease subunit S [Maritalea porphyrae]
MSITSGVGLVSQMEKFGRIIAGDSYKNYLQLKKNDFAYNKSATKEYPEGFIALYTGEELAAVPNSIFTCFRIKGEAVSPKYLNYLFLGNLHGRWLRKFIEVGARAHGSLSINNSDLLALSVPVPPGPNSLKEQQKIADCLASADALIEAQGRKVEALKAHKKGLMQQLFPQEGETKPRLRFPEFDGTGKWEECEFPNVIFFQEGPGIMAVDFHDHGVPLVRLSGLSGQSVTLEGCNYLDPAKVLKKWEHFRLEVGDIVVSCSATLGRPAIVDDAAAGAVFYTGLIRFRPKSRRLDAGYLEVFLGSPSFSWQAEAAAVGGGIRHFGPTHLRGMKAPLPPSVDEQQRIADCLTSLDVLITAETQKLDTLKTHKKGLMQQLFPQIGETDV